MGNDITDPRRKKCLNCFTYELLWQLNFISLAENESKARVRFALLEKMIQPCGPPADKKQED
jgi:hypothetical protein